MNAKAEAAAESEVVGAGLRDVQVIDEDAEFDAFLGEERRGCEEKHNQGEFAHAGLGCGDWRSSWWSGG